LLVHRGVHAVLRGDKNMSDEQQTELAEAALLSSKNERRAMEVEREVSNLYRAFLMRDKVGARYAGVVGGFSGSGVYVTLDAPFVDVMVRFEDLGGDRYELDDTGLRAVGERSGDAVQLGDEMLVEIADVSLVRRTCYAKRVGGDERTRSRKAQKHKTDRNKKKPRFHNAKSRKGGGRRGKRR